MWFLFTTGHHQYPVIANMPLQRLKYGWTEISGDFYVPNGMFMTHFKKQNNDYVFDFLTRRNGHLTKRLKAGHVNDLKI